MVSRLNGSKRCGPRTVAKELSGLRDLPKEAR